MSYRNDHEAALLRVDALEQEVARLRTAAPPKPAPKKRSRASLYRFGLGMVLTGACVVGIMSRDRTPAAASPPPVELPVAAPGALAACIAAIAPLDREIDATTTDPHGSANSTAWIAKTAAPCRKEINSIEIDPAVRGKLARWAATEDKLDNSISLIAIYYGNNPYELDNYASAPQLWREYHRTHAERDEALSDLKHSLAEPVATR